MKRSSNLLIALAVLVIPATTLAGSGASTRVRTSPSGQVVKVADDFSSLVDRDPTLGPEVLDPYFTADTIDSSGFFYGYHAGLVSKIVSKSEGGQAYAHFKISHDPVWDDDQPHYILADVEEGPSGLSYQSAFLRWRPTLGNPVVVKFDMRLPGCAADGAGCGSGTAGLVMWNGPVLPDGLAPDYKSIGFTFASADSDKLITGLTAGVIWDLFPGDTHAITGVDPSAWNHYKMIWSARADGGQSVEYKVNGASFGITVFSAAEAEELGNLGAEIWLDNYSHVVFLPDGTFTVSYGNPPVSQPRKMDFTNLVIKLKDTDD